MFWISQCETFRKILQTWSPSQVIFFSLIKLDFPSWTPPPTPLNLQPLRSKKCKNNDDGRVRYENRSEWRAERRQNYFADVEQRIKWTEIHQKMTREAKKSALIIMLSEHREKPVFSINRWNGEHKNSATFAERATGTNERQREEKKNCINKRFLIRSLKSAFFATTSAHANNRHRENVHLDGLLKKAKPAEKRSPPFSFA